MEQETPGDKKKEKKKNKDTSPRHRLLCGSFFLMSLASSICRPRHSLHILAVTNCIRIWTQFKRHLGQWNTSVTAPIYLILCSRPLWLRRLLFSIWKDKGIVFINHTSIAVLCILYSIYWSAGQWIQFTSYWSKCCLSRIHPNCNKSHWGPTLLGQIFCTCPALTLFWKSVFDSLSAITSATTWPSPPVGLFVCVSYTQWPPSAIFCVELVAFLTPLAKNMFHRCTGRILMPRLNRYGLRVFSIFGIWKKSRSLFVVLS